MEPAGNCCLQSGWCSAVREAALSDWRTVPLPIPLSGALNNWTPQAAGCRALPYIAGLHCLHRDNEIGIELAVFRSNGECIGHRVAQGGGDAAQAIAFSSEAYTAASGTWAMAMPPLLPPSLWILLGPALQKNRKASQRRMLGGVRRGLLASMLSTSILVGVLVVLRSVLK